MLEKNLQDKLNIINEIDSDYSRFVVRVLKCYERSQDEYLKNKNKTEIILKNSMDKNEN